MEELVVVDIDADSKVKALISLVDDFEVMELGGFRVT